MRICIRFALPARQSMIAENETDMHPTLKDNVVVEGNLPLTFDRRYSSIPQGGQTGSSPCQIHRYAGLRIERDVNGQDGVG